MRFRHSTEREKAHEAKRRQSSACFVSTYVRARWNSSSGRVSNSSMPARTSSSAAMRKRAARSFNRCRRSSGREIVKVEMTDDGSGPDEVFDAWAQTAIVPPPLASRDHRDLSAILTRGSRDGPSVSQTPRKDWGWPEACGEGNTIRVCQRGYRFTTRMKLFGIIRQCPDGSQT